MKIFIVGSINMDLVIRSDYMPSNGETIHGNGFLQNPGGKGANQAVASSKMGANTYMVGAVGEAFGIELIDTLNKYHVNTQFVEKCPNISSGIAMIIIVDDDNRIILDKGANTNVSYQNIDKALELASPEDFLVCQLEIPVDTVMYALKKAKEKKMQTVLNPAPATQLLEGMLEYVDYFIPNQSECAFFTGIYPDTTEKAKSAITFLKEKGIKNVIITLGVKGSCTMIKDTYIQVNARQVEAVDTTAAGDTYIGAFVTSLTNHQSLQEAMEFASIASSLTVTQKGAQQSIPYLDEVNKILNK